jgi:protein SCO1/2
MRRQNGLQLRGLFTLIGLMWMQAVLAVSGAENQRAAEPLNGALSQPVRSALDQAAALQFSQSVIGKPVGDYTLTDRAGRPLRLSQYRGKPLLVNFIYTGCTQVCQTVTRFLAKAVKMAQDTVGADNFAVVSIGFNLPFDTPQALKTFAKQQGVDIPQWEFLSPDPATLEQLTRDFGFSFVPTPGGFDHITQVTIVDQEGKVYRQIYGEAFEIPMLIEPLKALVTGTPAPAPSLAGWLEKVRILCTVYDPRSGAYRLNYGLFIEIFSGITIIGAIGYLFIGEWRRNRKAHDV